MAYLSKGVRYTLTDGTGSIALVVWQNVMEEIRDRYYLRPGSRIRVTGEIEEYEGDLEVIPHSGAEIGVLVQAESLPIEARRVNAITPADEGRVLVVEGQVVRSERRQWLKIWLADGTGEILIFVPERTVEYLPKGIEAGASLRVTGEVDIYQATLELIPLAGADVVRR
jgi:DNA/RNA endonuclease YhcR with UshA esterase domain